VIAPASSSDPDGCWNFWFANKAGTTKMQNPNMTAGIDTSKAKLDIAVAGTGQCWQVQNALNGWQQLAALLIKAGVTRVGIEATGGYEHGVVAHLRQHGVTVLVLQPVQVKAYARMHLRRAKNDKIDAQTIAACTAALDQGERQTDERLNNLAQNLTFVEQIEEDIARIRVRLEHISTPRLRRVADADIVRLKKRRAAELARIAAHLRTHDDLARRLDLVTSVPGIGERTALSLIVRMPELGRVSREEAAALAGLAPFDDDSGKHKGHRHIAGGRGRVRRSLYAAALPAAFRWNTALVALYKRLTAKGKAHKSALTACARKLLIYANTVLARNEPWLEKAA
jgi:transposase